MTRQINLTHAFNLNLLSKDPSYIVIHAMGERIEGVEAASFLVNNRLSAHALILPNGDQQILALPSYKCAHAKQYNSIALGVEILVEGDHDYGSFKAAIANEWVTAAQLDSVVCLCRSWIELFPGLNMVRHSDIDEKKIDPGVGFPWAKFVDKVRSKA